MIRIIDYVETYKHRATGWVQDASSFSNLHEFVSIFSHTSKYRAELIDRIHRLVESDLANKFIDTLGQETIVMSYEYIVGRAPKGSRKENTVCNGIGQAALKGQGREFQGEWSTNNFLRWAVSLQFVSYSPVTDTYAITEIGQAYTQADVEGQLDIIRRQLLMYAPAIRILSLLAESEQTQFSLGERLGFIGEKGFTNVTEKLFVDVYFSTELTKDRQKLKSNYEGSSDKYARQICSWLVSLSLVENRKKKFHFNSEELVLPSYAITPLGQEFLRRAHIQNRRFIPFAMLSMESPSVRALTCKRRALVLKALTEGHITLSDIVSFVVKYGVETTGSQIADDMLSLQNMGLSINNLGQDSYLLKDTIDGLFIPRIIATAALTKALFIKERLRDELKYIDHNLLVLVDFAYGSKATSRKFEIYVAKVYEQIYKNTFLLGGANKPDVAVCADGFVMIIDAKAYATGFALRITERDKMVRYIEEYKNKECKWFRIIAEAITTDFCIFQFVSSEFMEAGNKLADIARRTQVNGSAISAENLLRMVDGVLARQREMRVAELTGNQEIILVG